VIQMRLGQDLLGADVCYLVGPEPDFRWPTFVKSVVDLCRDLRVRMVVGLGCLPGSGAAHPARAPGRHRSPVVGRPGGPDRHRPGEIDVPSGVWGALELALGEADIAVVGLWARVPHYVSGMAFPSASAALLDGLAAVAGLSVDASPCTRPPTPRCARSTI
jgi:hypothetical protein